MKDNVSGESAAIIVRPMPDDETANAAIPNDARYAKEIYEGASDAMNGLFKIYFYSHDDELTAKCRAMMEALWTWRDKKKSA